MSSIFQSNSQSDYFLRQQRAAMRLEPAPGLRGVQKPAARPAVAGGSNSEFLKEAADLRASEKARANELARNSALDSRRDAAFQRRQAAEDRRLDARLDAADRSDRADKSRAADTRGTERAAERPTERPIHGPSSESSAVGSKVAEAAREADRKVNREADREVNKARKDNLDDRGIARPGPAGRAEQSRGELQAEAMEGRRQGGVESAAALDASQLGGAEAGLVNAYLSQNAGTKKAEIPLGKAAKAYETVIANLDTQGVATLNNLNSGELPKLINAKASAYSTEPSGKQGSVVDRKIVADGSGESSVAEGAAVANTVVTEEFAAIVGDDQEGGAAAALSDGTKEVDGALNTVKGNIAAANTVAGDIIVGQEVLLDKDIDGTQLGDAGGNAGKEGEGLDGAVKETKPDAQTTGVAATLKEAYLEAHTKEKGVAKEEKGKTPVTQKTLDSPGTETRAATVPKTTPQQGAEALNLSVEELAMDLGDAVDGAELVEAVTGKDQNAGSGLSREHGTGGHKQDMAAMKNDGKAEGLAQGKDSNAGVDAAKKTSTTAPPKTFNFGKLQEGVFNAVDRGLRLSLASGGQNAKLTLRPESLGELRIKLTVGDDGQVQSKIMVDSATVKSILDGDAARLKNIFSEQGLDLKSYSVEVGNGWSGKSARGGGSGFGFNGRGPQSAYGEDSGAVTIELDTSAIAGGAYGAVGGALDLFA